MNFGGVKKGTPGGREGGKEEGREGGREKHQMPPAVDSPQVQLVMIIIMLTLGIDLYKSEIQSSCNLRTSGEIYSC